MDLQANTTPSSPRPAAVPYQSGVAQIPDFRLESGVVLPQVEVFYETWGTLCPTRDNAVVVCHALTGDAHAGPGEPDGWWADLIGPGCAIDTDSQFVVATNVIGGCSGSTGPASLAPDGHPYALRFPLVSVRDIVAAQIRLLDQLEIQRVQVVIGGSLGGMQAWEWALMAPKRVGHTVVIAAQAAFPPLAIGYNEAMRAAIIGDPDWQQGNYYGSGRTPQAGLTVARAIGMLTYRTDALFQARFGRAPADLQSISSRANRLQPDAGVQAALGAEADDACPPAGDPVTALRAFTTPQFAIESYLRHQGAKLNRRFDANSYLYLSRAMDSHDIGRGRGGLHQALRQIEGRLTVVAIDSDYLYTPADLEASAEVARHSGVDAEYLELSSPYGHDAFLLEQKRLGLLLQKRLRGPGE